MVKNIPTIERSTKIRFGRNTLDDQAENTIVFNASDTAIQANTPGALYLTPIRNRSEYDDPNIVLLMYNKVTKEITESGEAATDIIETNLNGATFRGNVINVSTVFFDNAAHDSLVTASNVGIVNTNPQHTLSIGSNVYFDDVGSNVLVVSGNVSIEGNLIINHGVTTITTENLKIGDAIIELGKNNTSDDTTLDLGLIMTRPTSNVAVGFREDSGEFVMAYTESSADSNTITPLTSESLDVHVYGRVLTEANVGILNTSPIHTLDVGSNLYVDEFGSNILVVTGNTNITGDLTVDTDTLFVDTSTNSVGIETTNPDANLHVVGNVYVSSNLTVDTNTLHVDTSKHSVGIETKYPNANLHVVGNTYVSSNLTVDTNTLHVDALGNSVGVKTLNPDATLHVVGNTYVSSNLTVDTDTLHVDALTDRVGINTKTPSTDLDVVGSAKVSSYFRVDTDTLYVNPVADYVGINTENPTSELHVVGRTYMSSNLTVDIDTLHVDAVKHHVGIETKYPDATLHVVGNVYTSSNLTVDTDTLHVDAVKHHVGIETKYPDANLHVVGNTYVSSNLTVDTDTLHVDAVNDRVGINTKTPSTDLDVVGGVNVSSNLSVDTNTLHVDAVKHSVGIETEYPNANLHVVGNVYVSSNLTVDTETLHVDAVNKSIGLGTVNPTSNLHVVGNAYVTSNTTSDGTLTLNHPTTALITDLTSNVEVKLNQLANVVINTTDVNESLREDHTLVYDGSNWVNDYPKHTYVKIRNQSGGTLSQGSAVYVIGTHNANVLDVGLADARNPSTMPAFGIVAETITEDNGEGIAVTYGKALTSSVDTFIEGETVYVSNTVPGGLSNVKPYITDSVPELIQNVGIVTKSGSGVGAIFVTGVGRANDIPNAQIVLDETDINWVYVNNVNNDLKKIEPSNLLTQLQTLQQVTDTGNTTSNTIQFTNATTGIVTTGDVKVGGNISVADLTDGANKYLPMVKTDGFFEKSPVYVTPEGKYVISASEAEFLGNITLGGNTTIIASSTVTIEDRIFGVGANNSATGLDSGFMIEHSHIEEGQVIDYANIAVIHHADDHRLAIGYTQNTFTDNHILYYQYPDLNLLIDLQGNVAVQNTATIGELLDVTGATTVGGDLTVGAVSNLFVDVSTSRVGINQASPTTTLDVNGDMIVRSTTGTASKTAGALVVSGGLGVASNIHSTNVYASSRVGVGTVSASVPLHVMATDAGGIYVKNTTDTANKHSKLALEVAGTSGGDPFISWNVPSGQPFSMGIDNEDSDKFKLSNHLTDLATNNRLSMTPAGIMTLTNATNSTSKTTGALIVGGGVGVSGDVYVTNVVASSNLTVDTNTLHVDSVTNRVGIGVTTPAYALDVHGTSNVGALTSTSLAVNTSTLKVDADNNWVGINNASPSVALDVTGATNITADLTVNTSTLKVDTGNNRVGINNASPSVALDVTGATNITANLVVDTDTLKVDTANDRVGINNASPSVALDVTGATNITANLAVDTDTLKVDTVNDRVGVNTLNPDAALQVTGNAYVSSNLNVGANVFIAGGLVTNTGGVTKKTYSLTGTITAGSAPGIDIVFSDHAFSAKITAQLIESDIEISTLMIDVTGGRRGGASTSTLNIAKGPLSIFGDATSNPWSTTVGATATTVTITPSTNLDGLGYYNIFVEYVSGDSGGSVTTISGTSTGY
jgi:hypothetical protein